MAERPVFVPTQGVHGFVREVSLNIPWASGFAPGQKKKNIKSLHEAAEKIGLAPLLEVSTKSDVIVGQHLSAFHLKVTISTGDIPLECAFQGSKIFERGGPYTDLYGVDARAAKRDHRLQESGRLIGFEFEGKKFPLQPTTIFYDWLYLTALYPHRAWLKERLVETVHYAGFTDIEFNPSKSINCQARSCALFVALTENGLLDIALETPETFIRTIRESGSERIAKESERQLSL